MYIRTVSSLSKRTAFYPALSVCFSPVSFIIVVSFAFIASFTVLVSARSHPRSVSFCAPSARLHFSSFLKGSKDLTLNSDFTELVHGVSSRHTFSSSATDLGRTQGAVGAQCVSHPYTPLSDPPVLMILSKLMCGGLMSLHLYAP